jgi:hypothetical protein
MLRQRVGSTGVVRCLPRGRPGRRHDTETRSEGKQQGAREDCDGGIEREVGDVGNLGRGVGGMSCAHMPQECWWLRDKGGPCVVGLGEVAQAPSGLDR